MSMCTCLCVETGYERVKGCEEGVGMGRAEVGRYTGRGVCGECGVGCGCVVTLKGWASVNV